MKTLARFLFGRSPVGGLQRPVFVLWLLLLSAATSRLGAVLFLEDAVIGPGDTTYDGQDLIIWRCTVTVDGPHTFANVLVAEGGVLTHSPNASGQITNLVVAADERLTLTGTNTVALAHSNVLSATVRVTDPAQTVVFELDRDYRLVLLGAGRTALQRTPDSTIPDGSPVRVSYQAERWTPYLGLDLTVPGHVAVMAGAAIHANGRGHPGGVGPGAGRAAAWPTHGGSGGGYGGQGGAAANNVAGGAAYGSAREPAAFGSGGGAGLNGPVAAGGGRFACGWAGH
ncbi:MAG: hypothetical protein N3I86_03130 [Verrucomicrobiae bacterium]|nr:hypothetical protein [Verrucomicrobiae bacterium]